MAARRLGPVFGLAVFGCIAILLRPAYQSAHGTHSPLLVAGALFVAFGAVPVGFRAWFRRRDRSASEAETIEAAETAIDSDRVATLAGGGDTVPPRQPGREAAAGFDATQA